MASVQEIPATSEVLLKSDYSKQFLDTLLGQGWENWGQGLGGSQAAELMLQIFGAFNLVALAVILALFVWITTISVVGTAYEGVPFGKKYNSFWMPLRFVGAIASLAPIFKGLSFFQIAILACIGWSINLGNYVWNMGADFFVEHGGQITLQAPDQNVTQYSAIAKGALESMTLQYYMAERRDLNVEPGGSWKYSGNLFNDGGQYTFFFNGSMGKINIDCINAGDALCQGKVNSVNPAITELSKTAQQLANPDTPAEEIDPLALYNAANSINQAILTELQSYAKEKGKLKDKLKDFSDIANQYGWFIAGSSYWSISWINQEVREAMYSGISYSQTDYTKNELKAMMFGFRDYDGMRDRLANYLKTAYASRRGISEATADPSVTDEQGFFSSMIDRFKKKFNTLITANILSSAISKLSTQDPIMALSNIGDYLIGISWGLLPFWGGVLVFGGNMANAVTSFFMFSIFLPLLLYGLALAYFLPAIPFIRWISALGGWVILLVESLVAAPLWIAAHALPEGEGAAGQHGKRGYLLLLGIIIRPPLMVAGFFVAVILLNVLGRLIGSGFEMFVAGASQTKLLGLTGIISMLVILGIVVIMMANKFFSLIHYLPEHVTNWIGQQFHSLGEKEDQASAKGAFIGSTNAVSSGGHGAKELGAAVKHHYGKKETGKDEKSPPVSEKNLA